MPRTKCYTDPKPSSRIARFAVETFIHSLFPAGALCAMFLLRYIFQSVHFVYTRYPCPAKHSLVAYATYSAVVYDLFHPRIITQIPSIAVDITMLLWYKTIVSVCCFCAASGRGVRWCVNMKIFERVSVYKIRLTEQGVDGEGNIVCP